jgi:hypothetical protein
MVGTIASARRFRWHVLLSFVCYVSLNSSVYAAEGMTLRQRPLIVGVGMSIHDRREGVEAAADLGVTSVRIDAPWSQLERQKGVYEIPPWLEQTVVASLERRITPMLILAYGNSLYGGDKPKSKEAIAAFTQYAEFVAKHFRGRVLFYEIWNEWHTRTGGTTPGSAADYLDLVKQVYPGVKAIAPESTLLIGSFSVEAIENGWVRDFLKLEAYKYADGISVHPYVYMNKGSLLSPEQSLRVLDRLESETRQANNGRDFPIYVTEFGYPTNAGRFGIEDALRADYLKVFMSGAAARPYIRGVWWYGLYDQGDDRANKEHRFGLYGRNSKVNTTGQSLLEWTSRKTEQVRK